MRRHFTKSGYPDGVSQSALQPQIDALRGGFPYLFEAVVVQTYFVDSRENASGLSGNDTGVKGFGADLVDKNTNGSLSPMFAERIGYRVECDIYTLMTTHRGGSYQMLRHVPVMQRGGMRDIDLWIPKPCTNFIHDIPQDPHRLDGDLVLCQCVGGAWATRAVILGAAPHHKNFTDHPRSIEGERERIKRIGDGKRKDGAIRLSRYNGAVAPFIDRHGNLLFDTVEAGHVHILDPQSARVAVFQNDIPWTATGDVAPTIDPVTNATPPPTGEAYPKGLGDGDRHPKEVDSPGGGDVTFRVKDTRRFRIEFDDNTSVVKNLDQANPREFQETGFIQVHKGDGVREIEIAASDDLIINVRGHGGGSGTVTINCEQDRDGITLGGGTDARLQRFATRDFVEDLFLAHSHQTGLGPTSTPVVNGVFTGFLSEEGIVLPQGIQATTTKVRGE